MIYLLSDLHGDMYHAGLQEYLSHSEDDDILILLGDIGLNFENTQENRVFTDAFLKLHRNIAFIDGNHENFNYLYKFPVEEWNGGMVHRLTDHIVHLMRGNVFTIKNKTFFVFGGCKSSQKWKDQGLWYPQEEAVEEEYQLAYRNLSQHHMQVDYILTHKYEKEDVQGESVLSLQALTNFIDKRVSFKYWYSGHWHENRMIDEKHILVYDRIQYIVD